MIRPPKRTLWLLGFLALGAATLAAPPPAPQPPSIVFGELFDTVQRARVFSDSKTFADAIPKESPQAILAAWQKERRATDFDLPAFVARHFTVPEIHESTYRSKADENVCAHIGSLWPVLTRQPDPEVPGSSLLPLPHRYVVPGGRFREIYYWDSYFTLLGLQDADRALAADMLANFAHLIDRYGHIPNGNRTYYLSRSQPPFFGAMVWQAAARDGDAVFAKYLPQLMREHEFWMEGGTQLARGSAHRRVVRLRNGILLNRYWDDRAAPRDEAWREDIETAAASHRPAQEVYRNLRAAAESGWDFSSRWLEDGRTLETIRTVDLLPVDLNALLVELERAISRGHAAAGDAAAAKRWQETAEQRVQAIRAVFWNEQRRTFTDYLWHEGKLASQVTAAGLYPLYFGIATPEQAHAAAGTLRLTLLRPEGIVPTTMVSGQQWDAPNGWAPLEWIAISGLRRYGEGALADAIANSWQRENVEVFGKTGKLTEKYDVTGSADARGGEYPNQDGFGWTNGVLWALTCAPSP